MNMTWRGCLDDAAALDGAVAALRPDHVAEPVEQRALEQAAFLATTLARCCADHGAPEIAEVAEVVSRALTLIARGDVDAHHGQWRMASAMLAVRQALAGLAAGDRYAPVALAGARYELETLFPLPSGERVRLADLPETVFVPADKLVRKT